MRSWIIPRAAFIVAFCAVTNAGVATAEYWVQGFGNPGFNGGVWATCIYNNELVAVGQFTSAGGVPCNSVARRTATSWAPLGAGINGQLNEAVVFNGMLVVAGFFTTAGGTAGFNNIAAWDGSTWWPLGSGTNDGIYGLYVFDNKLYAGGCFTRAGTTDAAYVAQWDGQQWSPMGIGFTDGDPLPSVWCFAEYGGSLIAGGRFSRSGVTLLNRIARWNGIAWEPLGAGLSGASPTSVFDMCSYGGDLVVGGSFAIAGGHSSRSVARWDGTAWFSFDPGLTSDGSGVAALYVYQGRLYVGGDFAGVNGVNNTAKLACWTGTGWVSVAASVNGLVDDFVQKGSDLVVCGHFTSVNWQTENRIALYHGPVEEPPHPLGFTDIAAGLPGLVRGSSAWGDYDNDGDLDLVLTGGEEGGQISRIYRNDAGAFVDIGAGLPGAAYGGVAWGDYDNDGDLDLVLSGCGTGRYTQLYRNDAGTFVDDSARLPGSGYALAAWGDYDNDGDLDLVGTAPTPSDGTMLMWRNDAGTFTGIDVGLPGGFYYNYYESVAWGDYDSDGDLDLALADSEFLPNARVCRNDAGTFTDIMAGLPWAWRGDVAWGDYDIDGDLDLVLTGEGPGSRVYRNDAGAFTDIQAALPGTSEGSVAWADYDNDGDPDLLLAGYGATDVYRNDAGTFEGSGTDLPGVMWGSSTWGDYDNDGDQDLLLSGYGAFGNFTYIYRNDLAPANTTPTTPTALTSSVFGDQVTLSWRAGSDAETPVTGLSYSLRIGTSPGGSQIMSAMADGASGYRRVAAPGNAQQCTSWKVNLPAGDYYWTVQTVDGAWVGSPFAGEQTFSCSAVPSFTDIADDVMRQSTHSAGVALFDIDADRDLDVFLANAWDEPNRCLLNSGSGVFSEVIDSDFDSQTWNAAVAFACVDADTLPDVLLTGWNGVVQLLRNSGGGQFTDVTPPEIAALSSGAVYGATWFNLDGNRYPDLYLMVANAPGMVLANRGNFEFDEVGGGHAAQPGMPMEVVAGDIDGDGDQDLYLVYWQGDNHLLVNRGDGTFEDNTPPHLVGSGAGQAASFADMDNDLDLDLYVVNWGAPNHLFLNDGVGGFSECVDPDLQNEAQGQSGAWADYDLDGDLDLFITNYEGPNRLLRNDGPEGFTDVTPHQMQDATLASLGAAWGDVDGDADLDLLVGNFGGPKRLWRNERDNGNKWLQVRLRGVRSEQNGLGAKIDCYSNGIVQRREVGSSKGMWSQDPALATFGLGTSTAVDSVVVTWPDGFRQRVTNPPLDAQIVIREEAPESNRVYVAPQGRDDWPGSRDHPLRTIQHAVDVASPRGSVVLLDGTYSGEGNVNVVWSNKDLTIRSDSNDRTRCVIACEDQPGFVYSDTIAADIDSIAFAGISIVGANTAIAVNGGHPRDDFRNVLVSVSDCRIADGDYGLHVVNGITCVERTTVADQAICGVLVGGAMACSVTMRSCVIRRNNVGVEHYSDSYGSAVIDSTEIVGNGRGVRAVHDDGLLRLSHCRVDSSTAGDGLYVCTFFRGLALVDCKFYGNAGSGVRFLTEGAGGMSAVRCESIGNVRHGVELGSSCEHDTLDTVLVFDNGGCGVGGFQWDDVESASPRTKRDELECSGRLRIVNCDVRSNDGGGIDVGSGREFLEVVNTTVAGNGGTGIRWGGTYYAASYSLTTTTIVDNAGDGVCLPHGGGTLTRAVIAGNDSSAVALAAGADLSVTCSDIYANREGDWTDALAPQLGVNGNLCTDPMFCDAANGDYALQECSPLAAQNNANCGTIGRYDAACPAQPWAPFEPRVRDVPGDQGGQLRVSWLRHSADAEAAMVPVVAYEIQRLSGSWETIALMQAAGADSYAVTCATADILTVGAAAPYASYRLVARTALPMVFYESGIDSAYSIDNLPPPKPTAMLVDAPDYRYIFWTNPEIPDFASACVFRGDQAGFTPGEALTCPSSGFFAETHLAWYFYRVQFSDIHGNLSEFSDELHGQFPTGVSETLPTVLRLYPCRPNPFNPRTTIKYDLPQAGTVSLAVFDLAGRLVRTLVDESKPQGSFEAVWDGRDSSGREVSSGAYLARLEFGGRVETVRMGLVR